MEKKKDYDKIAKIEQAISKKYGKETVKHPLSEWTDEDEKERIEQIERVELNQTKVKKEEKNGFLLSRKLIKVSNRVCSMCKKYSFKKEDNIYMSKYDCCFKCYIQHIEGREKIYKGEIK